MYEEQIALVAQHGVDAGLASFRGSRRGGQSVIRLVEDFSSGSHGQGAPGGPTETHHLMQDAGAFHRQRHGRQSYTGHSLGSHETYYRGPSACSRRFHLPRYDSEASSSNSLSR